MQLILINAFNPTDNSFQIKNFVRFGQDQSEFEPAPDLELRIRQDPRPPCRYVLSEGVDGLFFGRSDFSGCDHNGDFIFFCFSWFFASISHRVDIPSCLSQETSLYYFLLYPFSNLEIHTCILIYREYILI